MTKTHLWTIGLLTTVALTGLAQFSVAQSKSTDLLTNKQVKELVATAKIPADHTKLAKHFTALAAKYEAEARDHVELAQVYRKNPTFLDTKAPTAPGTAAHCDRFADLTRQAAKEARDLAAAHEHLAMASGASK